MGPSSLSPSRYKTEHCESSTTKITEKNASFPVNSEQIAAADMLSMKAWVYNSRTPKSFDRQSHHKLGISIEWGAGQNYLAVSKI